MIKPKHIILIVILIVVVFLLYRFRDRLFLKKSIENFYSENKRYQIILEITYTDNCAAS